MSSPLLYDTGHGQPAMEEAEREMLRKRQGPSWRPGDYIRLRFEEGVVEHQLAVGSMGGPAVQLHRLNLAQLVQQRSDYFSRYGRATGALLSFVASPGFHIEHQAVGGSD